MSSRDRARPGFCMNSCRMANSTCVSLMRRPLFSSVRLRRLSVKGLVDDNFGICLGRAADAAEQRVDARRQLGGEKGFGDIVVRAGHKARDLVHLLRARREHDDADGLVRRTDAAADLEAVDIRQHDVQNGHAGVGFSFRRSSASRPVPASTTS